MDLQRWTCVIDLFGRSYDGTMPSIVFACDENWLGLFPVAYQFTSRRVYRGSGRKAFSLSLIQ